MDYDPVYGARPLKRAIQQYLENPLTIEILDGNSKDGSGVTEEAQGEQIVFQTVWNGLIVFEGVLRQARLLISRAVVCKNLL